MTSHRTLVAGSIRGSVLHAACTCGWEGTEYPKYGTAKNKAGRTVTAQEFGMEAARSEITSHLVEVSA